MISWIVFNDAPSTPSMFDFDIHLLDIFDGLFYPVSYDVI